MKKRKKQEKLINRRITIITYTVILSFFLIAIQLFKIIYIEKDEHIALLNDLSNVIIEGESAPRGRIFDRNHKLLVDNEALPSIVYKKETNLTTEEEIKLAYKISRHLTLPYEKLLTRNLKEFYLAQNDDKLNSRITEEEQDKLKRRILNFDDIYRLKIDRITDEDLATLSEDDRKAAYLYYLMKNGYSYQEKIIKENATDEEFAYFAENEEKNQGFKIQIKWKRKYLYGDTLKQILGTIGPITKEEKDDYLQKGYQLTDIVGNSYLEKQYEDILKGTKATYKKTNSTSLEQLTAEKRGDDIVLTIDIDLQQKIEEILKKELLRAKHEANTQYFNRSYVIIEQPGTGEILAMSGMQIIKTGKEYTYVDVTTGTLTDPMTPGSVVKGGSMLVGYNTGAIKFGTTMTDECIKIKSSPPKCSSHQVGRVDDIKAMAESSNVYQFKIAIKVGKGRYRYNEPLKLDDAAFDIYRKTFAELGLGVKTEIDLPLESLGYIGKKKDTNLLLNLAIGQYDTYTPIQLSQYITTLASNGNRLKPHLLKEIHTSTNTEELGPVKAKIEPVILNKVTTSEENLERIQEGMKAVISYGTGRNVMGKVKEPAGKTGTSESFLDTDGDGVIDTATVSNAFVGYAPYSNPEMTITVTSPDVENPNTKIHFHSYVNRRIAREISNLYFNIQP